MAICAYCGKEYIPCKSYQKYCSKECRWASRWHKKADQKPEADRLKDRVIELYNSSMSVPEISASVGVCCTSIYNIWRDAKLPRRFTKQQRAVLELRDQGMCSTEIAQALDIRVSNVNTVARRVGRPFTEEERKRSKPTTNQYTKQSEEEKELYVNSFFDEGFSYISGYVDCDSKVTIRCNTCGTTFERSMVSIRKGRNTICPECRRQRKEQKDIVKREKQIKLSQDREQRRIIKEQEQLAKTRTVVCAECGKLFHTTRSNIVCCSPECSRKRANRYCSHRKDKRIPKNRRIDRGITAKRLYTRDKGICWICGEKCDLDDYVVKHGNIICGDNYPSVDHITPVCEGGADSWDNVKLAHRRCNWERYRRDHA